MSESELLPRWAPRVKKHKIKRLYEDDARGMHDDELLEDVGYTLLCRCESFIAANQARKGEVTCPGCSQAVTRTMDDDELLECGNCGWRLSWARYFKTFKGKQLSGGEDVMGPFREYIAAFPRTRDARERMILIDQLIHGFHGYIKDLKVRRPVAVNLIEGRMSEVVEFLDKLSAIDFTTPALADTYALWRRGLEKNRRWYRHLSDEDEWRAFTNQ